MANLNAKQSRFVEEYLVDLNASAAARRAGYSVKTADAIGRENLGKPAIAAAIAEAQAVRSKRTGITADRVLLELAKIAFFDPRSLFAADGSPLPISDLSDDAAGALAGIEVLEEFDGTGKDRVFKGYTKKYKVADKNTALTNAMKHLGMLRDKVEHSGPDGKPLPATQLMPVLNITLTEGE